MLRNFNSRLYIGYGEDDGPTINCPPEDSYEPHCDIQIRYYDPVTKTLSAPVTELRSQQVDVMEVVGDKLFILEEDIDSHGLGYDFARCDLIGCQRLLVDTMHAPQHFYSIAEMNGSIYIAGSGGQGGVNGIVWRSDDAGLTWIRSLETIKPGSEVPVCCVRYNSLGVLDNKIYVQGYSYAPSFFWHVNTDIFDGASWSAGLQLAGARRRIQFLNQLIYIAGDGNGDVDLLAFNGNSINLARESVRNYTVDGGWLYVLTSIDKKIYRTKNLLDWSYLDTAPLTAYSLEILNNDIYVGTTDSKIYRSSILNECDFYVIKAQNEKSIVICL